MLAKYVLFDIVIVNIKILDIHLSLKSINLLWPNSPNTTISAFSKAILIKIEFQLFDKRDGLLAPSQEVRLLEPDIRRVLELIAGRPDGHVEALHVGFVVDRTPVLGDVIEIDNALHAAGDAE